jgi:hypothetical protein
MPVDMMDIRKLFWGDCGAVNSYRERVASLACRLVVEI